VAEPPAPALAALIALQGPVDAAAHVRNGDVSPDVAAETDARRRLDLVDNDFAHAATAGARFLTPEDEDWPTESLSSHADGTAEDPDSPARATPPIALWIRGEQSLSALLSSAVAVLGTCAATGYGETVAAEFGYGLSGRSITVVSDASYGIGGAALRGSMSHGGPVVTVLANGIDIAYPAGHANLLSQVPDHGLLISEYPPGTTPTQARFLARTDRTGLLSAGVVIVEAGPRSGSRRAARSAAELGRAVMAVPGPITSLPSAGTHTLLRECSAVPVATVDEILETIGFRDSSEAGSRSHEADLDDDGKPCG
jgi:DNA processing protein